MVHLTQKRFNKTDPYREPNRTQTNVCNCDAARFLSAPSFYVNVLIAPKILRIVNQIARKNSKQCLRMKFSIFLFFFLRCGSTDTVTHHYM